MSVSVRVPTPLRKLTQGADEVTVQGDTVKALVDDLERKFPGIKEIAARSQILNSWIVNSTALCFSLLAFAGHCLLTGWLVELVI